MTLERDSRVTVALRTTQRPGNLYPCPLSSLLRSPPAPDTDQTGGSPSMVPGQFLKSQARQGERKCRQTAVNKARAPSSGYTTHTNYDAYS